MKKVLFRILALMLVILLAGIPQAIAGELSPDESAAVPSGYFPVIELIADSIEDRDRAHGWLCDLDGDSADELVIFIPEAENVTRYYYMIFSIRNNKPVRCSEMNYFLTDFGDTVFGYSQGGFGVAEYNDVRVIVAHYHEVI